MALAWHGDLRRLRLALEGARRGRAYCSKTPTRRKKQVRKPRDSAARRRRRNREASPEPFTASFLLLSLHVLTHSRLVPCRR